MNPEPFAILAFPEMLQSLWEHVVLRGEAMLALLAAAVLGGLIGAEREHHGRSAGLRTQMLVALGAALAMLISREFGRVYADWAGAVRVDPARVAYGVMGGIGFIGAGAIIQDRAGIRGITTAASLWCTAAVGLACGFHMYLLALLAALIAVLALGFMGRIDEWIAVHRVRTVRLLVGLSSPSDDNVSRFRDLLVSYGAAAEGVRHVRDLQEGTEEIIFHLRSHGKLRAPQILELLSGEEGLLRISVE